jgi:acyl-CoA synthetase (AMP-forming)/AMP-acid ligase II
MASDLDRKFDEAFAAVTGPGGRVSLGQDSKGRAIVANLPPTLPSFFSAFCKLNAATEGVIAREERLTFAHLGEWSDRLARALVTRGIGKGDRVGIAMHNCSSWVVAYMAVAKAGAVATLLNGWWHAEEFRHALELSEPALIIADEARSERLRSGGCGIPTVSLEVDRPLEQALAPLLEAGEGGELPQVSPDDPATLLFTSGSTGEARAAVSTHRAVTTGVYVFALGLLTLRHILEMEGRMPPNPPRTLVNVPLFHVTGEVPVMLNSFVIGRGIVMMAKWDAGEALRLIEKEKVTYFIGVPTMSLEMMTHPDRDRYDLSSLTDIAAGGAPRPVSHVERLRETFAGANPAIGYGLTETNAVGAMNFWSNYSEKPASTGRPVRPLVEIAILGDEDRHLTTGETGEIAIRSAANMEGYWRNEDATRAAFTGDGYLRTGDIGYLDEDGYLFIVDRKKDIIIRGGENIAAAEVEAACYSLPDVAEVAVFGAPDERLGEVLVAVVHGRDGLNEPKLRAFLQERLAAFKIPHRMIFSEEPLPRLGTGKIDRVVLKAKHSA